MIMKRPVKKKRPVRKNRLAMKMRVVMRKKLEEAYTLKMTALNSDSETEICTNYPWRYGNGRTEAIVLSSCDEDSNP